MAGQDLLATSDTKKVKLQQPIINLPKALMDFGKGALGIIGRSGEAANHIYGATDSHHIDWGGVLNILQHGGTLQQTDADRASMRHQLHAEGVYSHLPHWAQGLFDAALDTAGDPTSYLGGAGVFRRAAVGAGEHALPAAMQLGKHLPQAVVEDAGKIHDATTGGGAPIAHMFRTLAAKHGAQGVQQGKRVIAAMTAQGAHQSALTQALDVFLKPLEALSKDEQTQVLRAIHGGTVSALPENLKQAAASYKVMTDSRFWLSGGNKVRAQLTKQGFSLPAPLKTFDRGPLGIARANNYRKNYVTLPHDLDPEAAEALATKHPGKNLGHISDPNLRRRAVTGSIADNPEIYVDAAHAANASSARAGSRMVLRKTLGNVFGGPAAAELRKNAGTMVPSGQDELTVLQRQMLGQRAAAAGRTRVGQAAFKASVPTAVRAALKSPDKKEPALNLLGAMQYAGDVGKGSIFVQPTGHMRNIASLLAAMNPAALPAAMKNFADLKFGFAGPAEEYEKLGSAMTSGAIGRSFNESTPFLDTLKKIPVAGKVAAPVYKASSKMLWGFDKAAKKAAFDSSLKETKDPLLAGFNVGKQLVNYENAAPWVQNSRFLAPFLRWRAGMPLALGKSIAEHPERLLMMNRATGGAVEGNPIKTPGGDYTLINPIEEMNAGAGRYARGSAGAWLKGLTYPNAAEYYLHSLPGVYQVSPPNPYHIPQTGKDKALFQFTGLSKKQSKSQQDSSGRDLLGGRDLLKP